MHVSAADWGHRAETKQRGDANEFEAVLLGNAKMARPALAAFVENEGIR